MKSLIKRIMSLAVILLLMFSFALPAFAAGTVSPRDVDGFIYGVGTSWVEIASGTRNFTIKRSDIKISKGTAGAKLVGIEKSYNTSLKESVFLHDGSWLAGSNDYNSKNCKYLVQVKTQNPGTYKITYKLNGETHKFKITVVPYSNPIKSISLTSVNGGKSFASLTKQGNPNKALTVPSTIKSAKLKVTPAGIWKLMYVEMIDQTSGLIAQRNTMTWATMGSATINWGKLYSNHQYTINVGLVSEDGNNSRVLTYNINSN